MRHVWLLTDYYNDIFVYDSLSKVMDALNAKVDEQFEQMTYYSKFLKAHSKQEFACQNFDVEKKEVL